MTLLCNITVMRQRIDTLIDALVFMENTEWRTLNKLSEAPIHDGESYAAAVKKLSRSEKDLNQEMLLLLEHAAKYPGRWHEIGSDKGDKLAAEVLEERGLIEIKESTQQYQLVPLKR
jgi:hypothetical protein